MPFWFFASQNDVSIFIEPVHDDCMYQTTLWRDDCLYQATLEHIDLPIRPVLIRFFPHWYDSSTYPQIFRHDISLQYGTYRCDEFISVRLVRDDNATKPNNVKQTKTTRRFLTSWNISSRQYITIRTDDSLLYENVPIRYDIPTQVLPTRQS